MKAGHTDGQEENNMFSTNAFDHFHHRHQDRKRETSNSLPDKKEQPEPNLSLLFIREVKYNKKT